MMNILEISRWLNQSRLSAAPCPWLRAVSIFVDERYENYDDYLGRYEAAARRLIKEGYVLEDDFAAMMRVAEWSRPLFEEE